MRLEIYRKSQEMAVAIHNLVYEWFCLGGATESEIHLAIVKMLNELAARHKLNIEPGTELPPIRHG